MARALRLKDFLRVKGPIRWTPNLLNVPAGDVTYCRWGFVPQEILQKVFADVSLQAKLDLKLNSDRYVTEGVLQDFKRYSVDFEDFQLGAKEAYKALATHFCDPSIDFRNYPLCSPRLALFLNECLDGYDKAGYMTPMHSIEDIEVVVQDIQHEFGNIDHWNKYFGVYDGQEIRFHLLSGALPEVTFADEISGNHPKRLATTVLYKVKEKFWFPEMEDEPKEASKAVHVLEYESPMVHRTEWRLRNFNKVINVS
eukprot:m.231286 g.231286  ORF g.231286 m.231286 type:complete len:254 (-) comp16006_c1_seq4:34-795(-)